MLRDDQRGFILSGTALLLVLPAMLISATFLSVVALGGETTSIQSLSDKVTHIGHDIKDTIEYMDAQGMSLDNKTLNRLAEAYEKNTGVQVERVGVAPFDIYEKIYPNDWGKNQGAPDYYYHGIYERELDRYSTDERYYEIKHVASGVWIYSFEDLDYRWGPEPDNDKGEPLLRIKRLDNGNLRITVKEYPGGYTADLFWRDNLIMEGINEDGEKWIDNSKLVDAPPPRFYLDVRDLSDIAHYSENFRVG